MKAIRPPLLLEMDWPNGDEPRNDIVIKDTQCPEGCNAREAIISEVPCEASENPPGGSRSQWNFPIDMGAKLIKITNISRETMGVDFRRRTVVSQGGNIPTSAPWMENDDL